MAIRANIHVKNRIRNSLQFVARVFVYLLCTISVGTAQERSRVHFFQLRNVELRAALDSLLRWYAVPLIYLDKDVVGKYVTVDCQNCGSDEALEKVLEGQGFVAKTVGNQIILQRIATEIDIRSTFAGTIRDSLTREPVFAADILLLKEEIPPEPNITLPQRIHRWSSTNQFGFFSLRNIQPGRYTLHIRRLGYRSVTHSVHVPAHTQMMRNFALLEEQIEHPEVTVEGRRSAFLVSEGISRGIYVRATPSDHNQYLLEGARIYNPLHFGGVMSSFNGDALRDVQLVAGGVPPFYGGRIGSILDVVVRDGAENKLGGFVSVGSLGSHLVLEGPLAGATTFMLSGRRSYPDFFIPWYRSGVKSSDLNSAEVMGKIAHPISNDQRFSLSAYVNRDRYDNSVQGSNRALLSNSLSWGNAAVNFRWFGTVSPSLFFSTSAIYSRYGFDVEHHLDPTISTWGGSILPSAIVSDFRIEDVSLRAHAEYFYDEFHTLLAGVELTRHRLAGEVSAFSSQVAPMSFEGFAPWELAVYVQDQWRLVPSVLAGLGARATSFVSKQGSFSAIDPRFSLLVSLREDFRLYSSLSAVQQFLHPYRHSGIFLFYPSIFFYPSTDEIKPSTSLQMSAGTEKTFSDGYRVAAETYYRTTQKLHEFVYDTTVAATLADALLLGEGNVYGFEVTLDKRYGALTGSLRYSFSWATNRFDELNDGEPFRPRFDRRHELYATLTYAPRDDWNVGAMCLLSSNEFLSFTPTGVETSATPDERSGMVYAASKYAEPYDLNGGRLPGFQRLELRVQHRTSVRGTPLEATLRLVNGYGLVDPFVWDVRQHRDERLKWRARFDAPPLFPLYPVLNVGVRF